MCFHVYLSTDSDEDLSRENSELVYFEKESIYFEKDTIKESIVSMLEYNNKWYVGSKSGCSCTFRHLLSYDIDFGFSKPVDWYEEDEEDIAATLLFIKIVRNIIDRGNMVDCINIWTAANKEDILEKTINLKRIADNEFRFFENHHFRFV